MRLIPEHKREKENSHVLTIDTRRSWEPQEKSLILRNDFVQRVVLASVAPWH